MLAALSGVASVLAMIALGFALERRGWFEGGAGALIPRLVVSVTLPAYMVWNLMSGYDRPKLLSMLPGLPVPFAVVLLSYAIAAALAAALKVPTGRRGTFMCQFAQSNTIFIGLPVNLALFGEESVPYVLLAYIANTTLFWTLGVYGISSDGAVLKGGARPAPVSAEGLKRIFSPPLTAFLLAVAMILAGVRLPRAALDFCKTVGSMTTPLSMIFIGIVISRTKWKDIRFGRELLPVLAGRMLVGPLILVLVARPLALPLLMKQVFLVQAAMPAMTQTPIVAEAYGADAGFAGVTTSLSTILCVAMIPLCMWLANTVF